MELLVRLLSLVILGWLVYRIISYNNGVTVRCNRSITKADKILKREQNKIKLRDKTAKFIEDTYEFLIGLKVFNIDKKTKKDLEYYALRMNITINDVKCDEKFIYIIKAGSALIFFGLVSIMSLFNIQYIVLVPVVLFVYKVPDFIFDLMISDKDKEIEKEINQFYSKFYYRIKFKQNLKIKMSEIAALYLPVAGKEMQLLCKSFIADCSKGEHYALEKLKENYKIPNIQRMSILILNTLNGSADSTQALDVFKMELDNDTKIYLDEQLERKEEVAMRVIFLCFGVVFELLIIYAINVL